LVVLATRRARADISFHYILVFVVPGIEQFDNHLAPSVSRTGFFMRCYNAAMNIRQVIHAIHDQWAIIGVVAALIAIAVLLMRARKR
jgi:hypothetical protein